MKSILSLLLLSATFFVSCKKDNTTYIGNDPNSLTGATVVSSGKVNFSDDRYNNGSIIKIYQRKDGIYVLGLEQMNYETAYSETYVYLSNTATLNSTSVKIFSTRKLHGDVYYPMSSDVNIPAYKYLIIQGDKDPGPVATAMLE